MGPADLLHIFQEKKNDCEQSSQWNLIYVIE